MLFDAHAHCFPPLGEPGPEEDAERTRWRLAEHQYHVRFHRQGIRRTRDDAPVSEPLLAGGADGTSGLPKVGFHVGRNGRVEFTVGGDDYYIQWMPPSLEEMSYAPDLLVAQMDYVGVDRAVLQHDRIYGRLDSYLADCVARLPERFVALAQVDEWRAGNPDQVERLRRQVGEQGFRGLYFSTGGFFHDDFASGINDAALEPLWEATTDLGISIHWYAGELRSATNFAYLRELVDRVGAHSLLWGSDMPACKRTVTYRQSLALFQNHCVDLTDTERTALVGGSLARLYPDP